MLDIVSLLDKTKFEPIILIPENGPLQDEINNLGVRTIVSRFVHVERRFFSPLGFIRFISRLIISIRKIKLLIENEHINLIHSNTSACMASAIASKMSRRPHIWHIRELCTKPKIIRFFYQLVIPILSDKAITASQAVRHNYSTKWNRLIRKFILLSHGVDSRRFENAEETIRKQFSISPGTKIVGNVGMLRAQKGQHLFLQAAKMVKEKYADVKFLISGDMYYENGVIDPDLRNLCSSLGLDNDVVFTGFRKDIENVFASFDVFVHTSACQESYGRTILEGMSAGKPVVAFNHGGPGEIVRNGQTGFLIPAGDPRLMAEKIVYLLSDDELRQRMGIEGRRIIRENYSNEKYIKRLEEIYNEFIN